MVQINKRRWYTPVEKIDRLERLVERLLADETKNEVEIKVIRNVVPSTPVTPEPPTFADQVPSISFVKLSRLNARVSVNGVQGASSYEIEVTEITPSTTTHTLTSRNNPININLLDGTRIEVRIRARKGSEVTTWSNSIIIDS